MSIQHGFFFFRPQVIVHIFKSESVRHETLFHLQVNELAGLSSSIYLPTSVQFSLSVVSDSLRPHESQHARPPYPSPTPGVCPNSCPSSRWCHPAISSSVVPFSSCPQSLPASESFPMSQLFAWGGQSIGVSVIQPKISIVPTFRSHG